MGAVPQRGGRMLLKGQKITLKSIEIDDIELIRNWRNSKYVKKFFIYREHISKEQQKKWFEGVSTSGRDFYFLIIIDHKPIGLTEIKKINWNLREGEGGIFIGEKGYRNSHFAFEAVVLRNDFSFYELNLNKIKAQVLESNKRALRFNKCLGYKEIGKKEVTVNNQVHSAVLIELTKNDYDSSISKSRLS